MTKRFTVLSTLFLILVSTTALAEVAEPECLERPSSLRAYRSANTIFDGEFLGQEKPTADPENDRLLIISPMRFRVVRFLKGDGPNEMGLQQDPVHPAFAPKPGDKWRIYAVRASDGQLQAMPCSLSRPLREDDSWWTLWNPVEFLRLGGFILVPLVGGGVGVRLLIKRRRRRRLAA